MIRSWTARRAVTIAAAAIGYDPGSRLVQVTDDDLPPFESHYDFGTSNSPVTAGYNPVSEGTNYTTARGYGWQSGTINGRDRSTGSALERDLNFTSDGTFVVNVPNATYSVTVRLGDKGPHVHDLMGVYLEGAQVDTVSTGKTEVTNRTYEVQVTDGQLTLRLRDQGGTDPNASIVGLDIVTVVSPLAALASIPELPSIPTLSISASSFSEAAGSGAATGTVTRTGVTTSPLTVSLSSSDTSEATVPSTVTILAGQSTATFAVNAVDDTDVDGMQSVTIAATATGYDPGSCSVQVTDDDRPPFAAHYDFGTSTSPVVPGYNQVSEGTNYTGARGYGWQSGTIKSRDRGIGSYLERDLNLTTDGTFVVDLPNGRYAVDLILGDTGAFSHDQMGVFFEGSLVDTVSTAIGQTVNRHHEVQVTDGQLTLRLRDQGGTDPNVCIQALDLALLQLLAEGM